MTPSDRTSRAGLLLFAGSIFASAFLIFLVQPMVGKRILPWFGGVPAVWTLCLAFYQTTLFAGYAYAHCLVRWAPPGRQLAVHAAAVASALFVLPVLPEVAPDGSRGPSLAILALLGAHVALPFLVLAATGPLVQAWFARSFPGRSPYPLYAVSNLGSLLALLGYPFLLEPRLTLSTTGSLWSWAFAVTGTAVLACAALAWRRGAAAMPAAADDDDPSELGAARVALWLGLSGCGVVLLMGVTNELCLDVASVPFLWVLPLTAYLLSLILCFGSERFYSRAAFTGLTALALVGLGLSGMAGPNSALPLVLRSVQVQVPLYCLLLFGACMLLHGELFRLRPPPRSLTAFYLCVSGGGALGGLLVGIVAPRVFDAYVELPLGLALAWLVLLAAYRNDPRGWLRATAPGWRWGAVGLLTAAAFVHTAGRVLDRPQGLEHQERSFFGVLRVVEAGSGANRARRFVSGTTLHGVQLEQAPRRPTSYFGVQTGIGLALTQREPGVPLRVGVVGLGIGTLAAYGEPGDRFRFYEIDPAVVRLARDPDYFTYLHDSEAEIEVVEGDGRLALEAERARGAPLFDVLVIDAFSSDAPPVHLITREAMALYASSLAPDGLLAVNMTNRYLHLLPLVTRLGRGAGLDSVAVLTAPVPRHLSASASWALLSRDAGRIRSLERLVEERRLELGLPPRAYMARRPTPEALEAAPLWTDDYSDLFGVLQPLAAW